MIRCMKTWRVLVLLVLSVLLPWRSAMAGTMPVAAAPAPLQVPPGPTDTHAHVQHTGDASACPHHTASDSCSQASCHETAGHGLHDSDHAGHSLCDVCNGPALGPVSALPMPAHGSPVGPVHGAVRFASRVLPIGHKPPIPV